MIVQEQNWVVDDFQNATIDPRGDPPYSGVHKAHQKSPNPSAPELEPAGVQFSEIMRGHIYIGNDVSDFSAAESLGSTTSSEGQLAVNVDAQLIKDGTYLGRPTGTFTCNALHAGSLQIIGGEVKYFVIDNDVSHATNLVYELQLLASDGKIYKLHGYKRLSAVATLSISKTWKATTTLYTTITAADGFIVGRGILHLPLQNLLKTVTGMRPRSNTSILHGMGMQLQYLVFFAKNIASWTFSPSNHFNILQRLAQRFYVSPNQHPGLSAHSRPTELKLS
jgi:hypothetical protein